MAHIYISIFGDINPNTKGNIYYPYEDASLYYSSILLPHVLKSDIKDDSFRINNGSIIIAGSVDDYDISRKATYAMERILKDSGTAPSMIFYHITRVRYSCGKIYFDIVPDDFANGFMNATISNVRISRTSRGSLSANVGKSLIYDGPMYPNGDYEYELEEQPYSEYMILAAVARIDAVVKADGFGNNPIQRTSYVAFDVGELYGSFNSAAGSNSYDGLTIVQDMLGGCYEGTSKGSDAGQMYQMKCSGIYIVPAAWIFPSLSMFDTSSPDYAVKTESALSGYTGTLKGVVLPMYFDKSLGSTGGTNFTAPWNAQKFIGCRGQWMKLPDSYKPLSAGYRCISSNSGIKVILQQGDGSIDITSAFVLPASVSNDKDSETTSVQKGIKQALDIVGSVMKHNAIKAASSIANSVNNNNANSNPTEGSAFLTYMPEMKIGEAYSDYVKRCHDNWCFPILEATIANYADCDSYIRNNGVASDDSFDNVTFLPTIASRDYLGDQTITPPADTFVQANLNVQGCPENERAAIEGAFNAGIRYIYVSKSSSE